MPSVEPLHPAHLQQIESSVSQCGQTIKHVKVLWGHFKGSAAARVMRRLLLPLDDEFISSRVIEAREDGRDWFKSF